MGLSRVLAFDEIRIAGRDRAKAETLAAEVGGLAVDSFEEAVHGADVVSATTHAPEPVVRHAWLRPGAHVTSVGVNPEGARSSRGRHRRRGRRRVARRGSRAVPRRCERPGGIDAERSTELGEVLAGKRRGRTNAEQITVYKSVGVGVMDAAGRGARDESGRGARIRREVEL